MKKIIGVVTTSRADFGLLYPVMKKILSSNSLELKVIATGLHLLKEHGNSLKYVKEKIQNVDVIDLYIDSKDNYGITKSIGIGFMSFSEYFKYNKIDLILVLGDRVELIVPVYSAMLCNIPVAHLFGGDSIDEYVTYDNNVRHSITKLSHLHFTATESHAKRIERLGEERHRIFNVGSPAIDYIKECIFLNTEYLQNKFNKINFSKGYALLTFHPVHSEQEHIKMHINNILEVLRKNNIQVICTKPNNDIGSETILNSIKDEDSRNNKFLLVDEVSQEEYYSLIKNCAFMIGNSSSIVLESTSFKKPSINIGNRQKGRIHGENIIDVDCSIKSIDNAIKIVFDNEFKDKSDKAKNPYGNGNASEKIVNILENTNFQDKDILIKKITY